MQDNAFEFTVRLDLSGMKAGVHTGLAMFDESASGLEVVRNGTQSQLNFFHLPERRSRTGSRSAEIQLRVHVDGDQARYSYSLDRGKTFLELGAAVNLRFSWWKGSRPALFAYTTLGSDPGAVDFDWVHYKPLWANPW